MQKKFREMILEVLWFESVKVKIKGGDWDLNRALGMLK